MQHICSPRRQPNPQRNKARPTPFEPLAQQLAHGPPPAVQPRTRPVTSTTTFWIPPYGQEARRAAETLRKMPVVEEARCRQKTRQAMAQEPDLHLRARARPLKSALPTRETVGQQVMVKMKNQVRAWALGLGPGI